jgi:hypothetical protein
MRGYSLNRVATYNIFCQFLAFILIVFVMTSSTVSEKLVIWVYLRQIVASRHIGQHSSQVPKLAMKLDL